MYRTLGDEQAKRERKAEREAAEKTRTREVDVVELWKPHLASVGVFEAFGKELSFFYFGGWFLYYYFSLGGFFFLSLFLWR